MYAINHTYWTAASPDFLHRAQLPACGASLHDGGRSIASPRPPRPVSSVSPPRSAHLPLHPSPFAIHISYSHLISHFILHSCLLSSIASSPLLFLFSFFPPLPHSLFLLFFSISPSPPDQRPSFSRRCISDSCFCFLNSAGGWPLNRRNIS